MLLYSAAVVVALGKASNQKLRLAKCASGALKFYSRSCTMFISEMNTRLHDLLRLQLLYL